MRLALLCGGGAVLLVVGAFGARGDWPLALLGLALGGLVGALPALRTRAGARVAWIALWTGMLALGALLGVSLWLLALSLTLALMSEEFWTFANRVATVENAPLALTRAHTAQVALAGLLALGLTGLGGVRYPALGFWPTLGLSLLALLSLGFILRLMKPSR